MTPSFFYRIFLFCCMLSFAQAVAQVPAKEAVKVSADTVKKSTRNNWKKNRDVFSDKSQLSDNDYLEAIEKANDELSNAKNAARIKGTTNFEIAEINKAAAALTLIIDNLNGANNNNVRNQQMYKKILLEQQGEIEYHRAKLDVVSDTLGHLKKSVRSVIRKDTIFRSIVRDSILRTQFKEELTALRAKWKRTDSLITASSNLVNNAKKEATEKNMLAAESLETGCKNRECLCSEMNIATFGILATILLINNKLQTFAKSLILKRGRSDITSVTAWEVQLRQLYL
jgi:potassium efflux system protein